MLEKIKSIFKKEQNKKEYQSCRYLQGGVTFMHRAIRTCCSNKEGINFIENYDGKYIDWKKIDKERKSAIENCKNGILPQNCEGCIDLETKVWEENNLIDEIYINHWDQCNCGCVYCVVKGAKFLQKEKTPGRYYSVYPHLKELFKKKMISKNAHVEMIGGDLTVLDETEDIINLCIDKGVKRMSFHSSCIYYSNGIERALKEIPEIDFDFSLDCGNKELYKKIKNIDAFDDVVANIKKYLQATPNAADCLISKYIIIDDYNDNIPALDEWMNLMHELGIKNTRIDLNFKRFFPYYDNSNLTVPKHYYDMYNHYQQRIEELGFKDCCWEFNKRVLAEGGTPEGYKHYSFFKEK